MSDLLRNKLAAVKRRHAVISALTGLSLAVGACIFLFAAEMLFDWWLELPYAARAAILAGQIALVGYLAVRYLVWPVVHGPDDETAALWVERWQPDFRSRLISSIQLTRENAIPAGVSPALVGAMVAETEVLSRDLEFADVVRNDELVKWGSAATILLVIAMLGLMLTREIASPLVMRALLVPGVEVPRKTRVEALTGHVTIARGDTLTVSARAHGIVPETGWIEIEYASGTSQRFPMAPSPEDSAVFTQTFDNVQETFQYRAYLNDGRSGLFDVKVSTRPAVASIQCEQVYPQYTRLGTVSRSPGDLVLLAGSRLNVAVRSTKPVRTETADVRGGNHLHLLKADGSAEYLPLTVDPSDRTRLQLPNGLAIAEGVRGFSINLIDDDGLRSKDPVVYRVDVIPDRAPTIRITHPDRREEMVTPQATVIVGFDAVDDFALGKMALKYKIKQPRAEDGSGDLGDGDGLIASYFPSKDFTGEPLRRIDRRIDFEWRDRSPDPSIKPDYFSARWVGYIEAPETARYIFELHADDGGALWINHQQVIPHGQRRGEITLRANERYPIKVEMTETVGAAHARLLWAFSGSELALVPGSRLYAQEPPEPVAAPEAPMIAGDGTGVLVEYFKNRDLKGTPLKRNEPAIGGDWGDKSPEESIPADNFSVRWSGQLLPPVSGEYNFTVSVDDGVRLWVDDEKLIDSWNSQFAELSGQITLTAGRKVNIRMECFEGGGNAHARLFWQLPNQPRQPIPTESLYPDIQPESSPNRGLNAAYFSENNLRGKVVRRTDTSLNFTWNDAPVEGIPADGFSARWTGWLQPEYSELYLFDLHFDDNVRLWIDDKLVFEKWEHGGDFRENFTIQLEAGKLYPFKLEFREVSGPARLHVWWESDSQPRQIIPRRRFYRNIDKGPIDTPPPPKPAPPPPPNPDDLLPVHSIDLDLKGTPKSLRGQYPWAISSISPPVPIGTVIEWWLEAEDTNDATGPGKVASEHYQSRIVTVEQKREELQRLTNDAFGSLNDLNEEQQELNEDLGVLITEQAKPRP